MRPLSGSLLLTFRELWAMRITQGMFAIATLAWVLLSFALNMDIVEGSISALKIFGFDAGAPMEGVFDEATGEWVQQATSIDQFVIGINQFVFGASYFLGTLLGLFATMPLIAGFLEQGRIDLLLSKPVSRPRLLFGHLLGVWLTVVVLACYLVGGVWLSLSLKTGIWVPRVLVSIPVIVLMFAVMYSVVLTTAILSRTSGLGLVLAYGLIFFSAILASHEQLIPVLAPTSAMIFKIVYHSLPNFIEVVMMQAQLVEGSTVTRVYPFISSLIFGVIVHGFGFYWFSKRDF